MPTMGCIACNTPSADGNAAFPSVRVRLREGPKAISDPSLYLSCKILKWFKKKGGVKVNFSFSVCSPSPRSSSARASVCDRVIHHCAAMRTAPPAWSRSSCVGHASSGSYPHRSPPLSSRPPHRSIRERSLGDRFRSIRHTHPFRRYGSPAYTAFCVSGIWCPRGTVPRRHTLSHGHTSSPPHPSRPSTCKVCRPVP